jgi:hypothetical protein
MANQRYFRYYKQLVIVLLLVIAGSNTSCNGQVKKNGFVQIFNGKSLEGWEGDGIHWRAEAGKIIGEVTPSTALKTNTFLIWKGGTTTDFELRLEFHITTAGNSGINYRSEQLKDIPFALKGYQADIDGENQYTGQNYEERGRGFLAMRGQKVILESNKKPIIISSLGGSDSLKALIKTDNWNRCTIIAKGNRIRHFINGVLMSDVTDKDAALRKLSGVLGLQVHVGAPMKVEYRNIMYRKL